MIQIVDFTLISEKLVKDPYGQTVPSTPEEKNLIGNKKSVYQNEYFKAEQAGLRAQGIIEMSKFDYSGESKLKIGGDIYTIYRTFDVGTDRIELYYGERVGNNG